MVMDCLIIYKNVKLELIGYCLTYKTKLSSSYGDVSVPMKNNIDFDRFPSLLCFEKNWSVSDIFRTIKKHLNYSNMSCHGFLFFLNQMTFISFCNLQ